MTDAPKPWCVMFTHSEDGQKSGWCATYRNALPSPDAFQDKTACGKVVIMRVGDGQRDPTCEACKKVVARRGPKRKARRA